MTAILHATLSHPTVRPKNLCILPGKKSWLLNLDVIVFSDAGNIFDAIFMAARAALWDTKVPRTRSVQYRAKKSDRKEATQAMDVDETVHVGSALDTRETVQVSDFELPDYWDEGEPLDGRQAWPVCLTLNLVRLCSFAIHCNLIERWAAAYLSFSRCHAARRSFCASQTPCIILLSKRCGSAIAEHALNGDRRVGSRTS